MWLQREALTLALIISILQVSSVLGHGRLLKPPARGSAWRFGFDTPKDYNDNAENCGGLGTQWNDQNKGKCGICGDRWDGERENETPGKYASGTIVATYSEGQVIDIEVQITKNHKGWFEFRLCENNDIKKDKSQTCFDQHLLQFAGSGETRVNVGAGEKIFKYKLKLPQGVTCSQCILQWYYKTGNSWGIDFVTKKGCEGCGPQETFWGCSDIAISAGGGGGGDSTTFAPPTAVTSDETTTTATTTTTTTTTTKSGEPSPSKCRAVGVWKGDAGMDKWCVINCARGMCPSSDCSCN